MKWWHKATARQAVLTALADGEWWYVLDLMRESRVSSGRMYETLSDLESEGLVEAKWAGLEPGQTHRRRLYRRSES